MPPRGQREKNRGNPEVFKLPWSDKKVQEAKTERYPSLSIRSIVWVFIAHLWFIKYLFPFLVRSPHTGRSFQNRLQTLSQLDTSTVGATERYWAPFGLVAFGIAAFELKGLMRIWGRFNTFKRIPEAQSIQEICQIYFAYLDVQLN